MLFFYIISEKGFLGVYNPDPELLHNLIVQNEIPSSYKSAPSAAAAAPGEAMPQGWKK